MGIKNAIYFIKLTIISTPIFLAGFATGQSDSTLSNKLNVRIAPLSLIDVYNGSSYKLGFEFQPFKSLSITGDFGGYLKNFNVRKTIRDIMWISL